MKKITLFASVALMSILLGACQQKTETKHSKSTTETKTSQVTTETNSTNSSSEEVSTETEEQIPSPATATMDIEAISQGDYSSVIGLWQNGNGNGLSFNSVGLTESSGKLQGNGKLTNGVLEMTVKASTGVGFGLLLIPAGVEIPHSYYIDGVDTSDQTQDRMLGAQAVLQNIDEKTIYYRVSPLTSTTSNPLTNEDTGVKLDSGQVTIDYANAILGNLDWEVIESNYNRTEGIPFVLLQGNDGSLFRIYRNGVILSQATNQVVYIP